MKPFKSLLCLSAVIILFAAVFTPVEKIASAATVRYARADDENVYFCKSNDLSSALFRIPYSYCVEIISTEGEWYYVKYAENVEPYEALYGYCLKGHLTPVEVPPENIYLNLPVKVTYRPDTAVGSLPTLGAQDVIAAFYGSYKSGATNYSYVGYKGQFGYIDVDIGINDYPHNEIPNEPEEISKGGSRSNAKVITMVVLAGLAAATLIVLYFASRKRTFKP